MSRLSIKLACLYAAYCATMAKAMAINPPGPDSQADYTRPTESNTFFVSNMYTAQFTDRDPSDPVEREAKPSSMVMELFERKNFHPVKRYFCWKSDMPDGTTWRENSGLDKYVRLSPGVDFPGLRPFLSYFMFRNLKAF